MSAYLGGLPKLPMFDAHGNFTPSWQGWFSQAQTILTDCSNSGPTTARPTQTQYVGKKFFDTTLGIPIWMKTPGSSPVWVNASGVPV